MNLAGIDPGSDCPASVRMIVEIPKNSVNKYEYDIKLGIFHLDRTLYSPMHYPADYGFIPGTMAEDGDPIDILAMVAENEALRGGLVGHGQDIDRIAVLGHGSWDESVIGRVMHGRVESAIEMKDPEFDVVLIFVH